MITQATPDTWNDRPILRGMSPRRFDVLARADFRCAYCGIDLLCDFDTLFGASVDHLRPRCSGGLDGDDNAVAACRTCNQLKGDFPAETVDQAREVIAKKRAEFLAGFVGRACAAGVEFPREIERLGAFAPEILAALGSCAHQAEFLTGRLRTVLANAEAIKALLDRYRPPGLVAETNGDAGGSGDAVPGVCRSRIPPRRSAALQDAPIGEEMG